MSDKKKFGLVMPKKSDALKIKKNSVFDDDSDEDERISKRPKIPQKKMETLKKLKTSLTEDPSIYEYDNIYDEMKAKQTETVAPEEKKNSRYIETLMKAAEKRKKEYERRIDKKIQAEREKEGDKYQDKEAFVTSSYKKKILEQEKEEEKERRENMLNDMMDVTKQKDLSGFYRHFLKQTVGEEKVPQFGERKIKEETVTDEVPYHSHKSSEKYESIDQDTDNESSSSDEKSHSKNKISSDRESKNRDKISNSDEPKTFQFHKRGKKYYRKSKESPNSRSSSSNSEEDNLHTVKSIQSDSKKSNKHNSTNLHDCRHDSHSSSEDDNDQLSKETADTDADHSKIKNESKFNIYAKRTIENVFAEAQARYFQRMALKKSEI